MTTDVLIVGAGPVGLTLALLLARHGVRSTILERRTTTSAEPRAVSLDDEALRIWHSCGVVHLLREDWDGGAPGQIICSYLNDRGRPFLEIRQRVSDLGYPHAISIHQGRIDEKLAAAAQRHPFIRLVLGATLCALTQDEHGVTATFRAGASETVDVRTAWAIGCDGGCSDVRGMLGIPMMGAALPHSWLIANFEDTGPPGHVMIHCSVTAPAVTMPIPHGVRRVERMIVDSGDDDSSLLHDERRARQLLAKGWTGALDAPLISMTQRRFSARVAQRWRDRRVFLAGDAAHVSPPFAGQGLCAGLRDAANLSFKLAGVIQRWLPDDVLDTYESERRPHQERLNTLACRLGRLMSPRSPWEGAAQQCFIRVAQRSKTLSQSWLLRGPDLRPHHRAGFLSPSAFAGRYLPQPLVRVRHGGVRRLDDLLGPHLTWIAIGSRRESGHMPDRLISPYDSVLIEGRDFRDPARTLQRRFGPGACVLVRPDRIVHTHMRPRGQTKYSERKWSWDLRTAHGHSGA